MAHAPPRHPLIAIIGATGTGKSQLAVEIAKRHNGEIINGDAMQLYAGLPIITNKITAEEQKGVPHHLLGRIGLDEQTWVVSTFVRNALKTIEEIRARGRLPILVGGTHYYTQSLLFRDRLAEKDEGRAEAEFVESTSEKWPILQEPTEVLLKELKRVDPIMADRWHPNDRRKIQRSLEIYLQTGQRASETYAQQRQQNGPNRDHDGDAQTSTGPEMRFPTLLFWVHTETETLRARLDKRVEKMLSSGLLDEVQALHAFAVAQLAGGHAIDETRGIWVSIGYKEFKEYISALDSGKIDDQRLASLKAEALERTKIATRQYAKRQIRWIRIKLVNALADAGCAERMYLLDASNVPKFDDDVVSPALDLTEKFLRSETLPAPSSLGGLAAEMLTPKKDYDLSANPEKWAKHYCELCNVTCVTPEQWTQHTRSKTHKKLLSKSKAAALLLETPAPSD